MHRLFVCLFSYRINSPGIWRSLVPLNPKLGSWPASAPFCHQQSKMGGRESLHGGSQISRWTLLLWPGPCSASFCPRLPLVCGLGPIVMCARPRAPDLQWSLKHEHQQPRMPSPGSAWTHDSLPSGTLPNPVSTCHRRTLPASTPRSPWPPTS